MVEYIFDLLQTIAILVQGISAVVLIIVTVSFNKGIKKIDSQRRSDEEKRLTHERNQIRTNFIISLQKYSGLIEEAKRDLTLKYQSESEFFIDFFVLKDFLKEIIELGENYKLNNGTILDVFNKYFNDEYKNSHMKIMEQSEEPTSDSEFFLHFDKVRYLKDELKIEILKFEVQTLINPTKYLVEIKEIEMNLQESSALDGHLVLDLTNSYVFLDKIYKKINNLTLQMKKDIER